MNYCGMKENNMLSEVRNSYETAGYWLLMINLFLDIVLQNVIYYNDCGSGHLERELEKTAGVYFLHQSYK